MMKIEKTVSLPLVYSCSGCSSAAQMANFLALQLDQCRLAEMSCIAGVGGGVTSLVKKAKNAKQIIGIDGCGLACVKACLQQHGLEPGIDVDLGKLGVKKKAHQDFSLEDAQQILSFISARLKNQFRDQNGPAQTQIP